MVNEVHDSALLRWIAFLPLAAAIFHAVVLGVVRRGESPRWLVISISCGAVVLAFVLSCIAFGTLLAQPGEAPVLVDDLYTWIGAGLGSQAFSAELGFRLDPISAVMILVVTGVGALIHIYSVGYMDDDHRDDKGFQRFFCYLNLFTFSMLVLVLADNLVLMFLGWEGVGLCSYLLIGFWYSDTHNAYCGSKAFIVNRIGDFGFLVGLFLLFAALSHVGTPAIAFADLARHFEGVAALPLSDLVPGAPEWRVVEVVALCFFVGACGKSAQIPLYTWLPDAMAGPTPVSALIHAATMVTAGVYMICRLSFLYSAAPVASAVVAWTGGLTAVFAASIAVAQTDIKKVLAYSTVSQLGYMFLAAGCGGYAAAMFHLTTHAFFKALLFLGAGSVILAMHHEQDMDKMGKLGKKLRQTRLVFLAGVAAISGFPGLSGFFSKDETLVAAWSAGVPGHGWLYAIGLGTAGLTSFYMYRLYFRVFRGQSRVPEPQRSRIQEPGAWVVHPLWVLAFFAVFAGLAGLPQIYGDLLGIESSNSFGNFLEPAVAAVTAHEIEHSTEYWMTGGTLLMFGLGLGLAWLFYVRRPALPQRIREGLGAVYRLVWNKYYVDELYDAVVVRPLVALSDRVLFRIVDHGLIDGVAINGTARGVRGLAAHGLKYAQSGLAQSYIFFMIAGAAALVGYLLR
jgi:NADH-quinone oxidoreductase subunit L